MSTIKGTLCAFAATEIASISRVYYPGEDLAFVDRPKEGDLVYFPLGERFFEIKRVESEKPFYQLGTNYVYELSCELYEYENELIPVVRHVEIKYKKPANGQINSTATLIDNSVENIKEQLNTL